MGGLRHKIPLVFWSFVAGGGALVALPFVTVGFYSKEAILWETYATGHMGLFWAGVFGAFLTSVYTFRLIYLVFFGQEKTHGEKLSGISYALPLVVLLVLSTGIGAWIHPPLANVLPASVGSTLTDGKHTTEIIAVGVTALGLALAYFLYVINKGKILTKWTNSTFGTACVYWCYHGLGFDALYDIVFVKPFLGIAKVLKSDPVDKLWYVLPFGVKLSNKLLLKTQTGRLGTHVVSFGVGLAVVLVLAMMMVV